MGQGSRSNAKNRVFTWLLPCFKVKVKGRVQGQRSGSRSNFWRTAVDNRGSALPSAAKSNKSHYEFKVFVCVSVISGRKWIITRMRSIGVLIDGYKHTWQITLFSYNRHLTHILSDSTSMWLNVIIFDPTGPKKKLSNRNSLKYHNYQDKLGYKTRMNGLEIKVYVNYNFLTTVPGSL